MQLQFTISPLLRSLVSFISNPAFISTSLSSTPSHSALPILPATPATATAAAHTNLLAASDDVAGYTLIFSNILLICSYSCPAILPNFAATAAPSTLSSLSIRPEYQALGLMAGYALVVSILHVRRSSPTPAKSTPPCPTFIYPECSPPQHAMLQYFKQTEAAACRQHLIHCIPCQLPIFFN